MGPNKKPKAPKYPLGTPGKEKRFAGSSRRKPSPTGMDPSAPGYGTMTSGNAKDPIARAARVTGTTTSRNVPTGQDVLTKKVRRQAY
jgi:hypothetical protein